MNGELNAKAEAMLMGLIVNVKPEEVEYITRYIVKVLVNCNRLHGDVDELTRLYMNMVTQYHKNTVEYMCINVVMDMIQITYVFKSRGKLDTKGGKLAYVVNTSVDYFSELTYCFFYMKDGRYHRY